MPMRRVRVFAVPLGMVLSLLAGCHVDAGKHGDASDVKISTPFGGLQVKTNDAGVLENIGLPAYPGAEPLKKEKDSGSADVNMHFGGFQLRVKAATFKTPDPPEKVETFYREDLKRFGDIIACRDDTPVGTPTRTLDGLTCARQNEGHISVDDVSAKSDLELKTGSRRHQHIVSIQRAGSGTKFALVVLDLPGSVNGGPDDDAH